MEREFNIKPKGSATIWQKIVSMLLILAFLIVPGSTFFLYPKQADACLLGAVASITALLGSLTGKDAGVKSAETGVVASNRAIAVPVSDLGTQAAITTLQSQINSSQVLNSAGVGGISALTSKECLEDALVTILAKTLIKQVSRSIVDWIDGGFDGSPLFVTDPKQFFLEVGDRVSGEFIEGLGLGFLCSPFEIGLQISLNFGRQRSYVDDLSCTVSGVISNFESFVQGNFVDGGWEGWFEVTQNPANNPYGSYITAWSKLGFQRQAAIDRESQVLDWGKGFKSVNDAIGKIITPGATIENQLSLTLGTDLRQLEIADEINEIVGALIGQLVNQVIGPGGLLGAKNSGPDYSNGGFATGIAPDYVPTAPNLIPTTTPGIGGGVITIDPGTGLPVNNPTTPADPGGGFDPNTGASNNIAVGKGSSATQSSTYTTGSGNTLRVYGADKAVDGIQTLDGLYSVAITKTSANPWWQIDLGKSEDIGTLRIVSNTNPNTTLGSIRIFVSDKPFPNNFENQASAFSQGTTLFNGGTVWASQVYNCNIFTANTSIECGQVAKNIPLNTSGQFVRVQRLGTGPLHLAEVLILKNNPPFISIEGPAIIALRKGDVFVEPTYTVTDDTDTNLHDSVVKKITFDSVNRPFGTPVEVVQSVDTNRAGTYTITYNVTDSGGAKAIEKNLQVLVSQ